MFPSPSPELHASVDCERRLMDASEVVSASTVGSAASALLHLWNQRRSQSDGYSLPLKTAATTIAG